MISCNARDWRGGRNARRVFIVAACIAVLFPPGGREARATPPLLSAQRAEPPPLPQASPVAAVPQRLSPGDAVAGEQPSAATSASAPPNRTTFAGPAAKASPDAQPVAETGETHGEVIEIRGRAAPAADDTGSKLGVPLSSLPATVNTVSTELLRERGADDLDAALGMVAGVNPVFRYGGFQFMTVRGFADFLVLNDGVRDDRHTFVQSAPQSNLADVDHIDVLKGPASVLYGYGAVGGVVNLVRKQPAGESAYEFGVAAGTPETRRTALGMTGPLLGDGVLYRLDLGQSFQRDFRGTATERNAGTLQLLWRHGHRHRLRLRATFQRDHYDTDAGIPTVDGRIPAGVSLANRYNTPQDRMLYGNLEGSADYRVRLSDNVEIRERLWSSRNDYDYFSTEFLAVDATATRIDRGYFYFNRHWRPVINQLELHGRSARLVPSRWLVGHEFAGMWGHSDRSAAVSATSVASIDIVHPGVDSQPEVPIPIDGRDVPRQQVHALYAHEHASLPGGFDLALGARVDLWKQIQRRERVDPATSSVIERGDETRREAAAITYRAGLVYRPRAELASYLAYSTSFEPTMAVPDDGRQLDPERGRQLEIGQRLRLSRAVEINIAVYDLAKTDVVIDRGMGVFDQAGRQSSRGVELDVTSRWRPWLDIRAGYAYTRARFNEFALDGVDLAGRAPRFVPDHMANLWVNLLPTEAINLAVGGRVVGRTFADNRNEIIMPAYAVADAAVTYRRGHVRAVVTVKNVLDERDYFVSAIYRQLYPGPPRQVLAQLYWNH